MGILKIALALFFLLFAIVDSYSQSFSYEFKVNNGEVKIIFQNSYVVDDKKLATIKEKMERIDGVKFGEYSREDTLKIGDMLMEGRTISYTQAGGNYSAVAKQIATIIKDVVAKKKEKVRQVWPEKDHSGS